MNKQDWTYKQFEDCLIKAPKAKQVQTSEYNSGSKYPIISQEDKMVSGYCDDSSLLYHIDNPIVIFGDHTRVLKYVDFDFVVGADGVKILIPKDFLKAKFLLYYLRWYQVPSLGYSRHYKLLKEIVLPIPPIDEQERIVAELDLLSSIIEKKKAQLQEYDQLAQSIFYDMFGDPITNEKGWEVRKLGEISTIKAGYTPSNKDLTEQGVLPYFKVGDMNKEGNEKYLKNSNSFLDTTFKSFPKGAIVFPKNGAAIATNKKRILNQDSVVDLNTAILVLNESIILDFIYSWICQIDFRGITRRGAVPTLDIKVLLQMNVILPPLALQMEFAEKIEAIEKQKALVRASIVETETLFNSRMDYYFN